MPEFNEIDAKQARQLAENNNWLLNHLYKEIRSAAAQNTKQICWCVTDAEPKAVTRAVNELRQKGFTIEEYADGDESLIIKW